MRNLLQRRGADRIEGPYNASPFEQFRRDEARPALAGDPIHIPGRRAPGLGWTRRG